MSTSELAKFLIIHVVVPVLGVVMYFWLLRRMYKQGIEDPPVAGLFIIFLNYGALLLLMLTSLFWYWSAMASLGGFYAIIVGPFFMVITILHYRKLRNRSVYHRWVFRLAIIYPLLIAGMFIYSIFHSI